MSRSIHKFAQDKLESDTLLEGRAAEFSMQIEKKMISLLDKVKSDILKAWLDKEQVLNSQISKIHSSLQLFDDEYQERKAAIVQRENQQT